MQNEVDLAKRHAKALEDQTGHETELKTHRPTRDAWDDLICQRCDTPAPCNRALALMKAIQQCRTIRHTIHRKWQ